MIILVTNDGLNYRTARVEGKSSTSVISAQLAASSLGKKLFGRKFVCAQQVIDDGLPRGKTRWELVSEEAQQ